MTTLAFSKTRLDETIVRMGAHTIRAYRNPRPGPRWTASVVVHSSTQKESFCVDGKTLGNCLKAIRHRLYAGPQRLIPMDYN